MSDWNPEQYHRFQQERRQPFIDLMALVRRGAGMRVVDLGCGTGELTQLLHRELQARETLGIDASEAMLAKTVAYEGLGLRFEKADLRTFAASEPYDLVFSNAALQWVANHESLIERLTRAVAPGGQLAVQVPANHAHPSQTVAAEVAAAAPFREALQGYTRTPAVLLPEEYAVLLDRLGYEEQLVRLQVYGHRLAAPSEVVEWVKGTLLIDYQQRMEPALFAQFLERYRAHLLPKLADTRPYFFPFKRILMWAVRRR